MTQRADHSSGAAMSGSKRARVLGTYTALSAKARRYLRAFGWIMTWNLAAPRSLLISSVGGHVSARLGNLIAFIAAIKCAIWILAPEAMPHSLRALTEPLAMLGILNLVLLLIPTTLFALSALAQWLANETSVKLRLMLAHRVGLDAAASLSAASLALTSVAAFANKPQEAKKIADAEARKILTEYKIWHSRMYRIQANFMNFVVSFAVMLLSVCIGLFLDFVLVSTLVLCAIALTLIFVWHRHGSTHQLDQAAAAAAQCDKLESAEVQKDLAERLLVVNDPGTIAAEFNRLEGPVGRAYFLREAFTSTSSVAINLGQSAVMVLFLTLVSAGPEAFHVKLAIIVILLMLLRFTFAALQGMATSAVAFARDYPFIIEAIGKK